MMRLNLVSPPLPHSNRQPQRLEALVQGPARCIDHCRIFECRFGLRENAREPLWLRCQEILDQPRPLLDIAGLAGKGEVAHPVRPASCFTQEMLDFQGNIRCITVGTLSLPLFEQVFPYLVAKQRSLLVLDTCYFGVLHLLKIEAHEFLTDGDNRAEADEPPHPCHHVAHPALQ